MTKYRPHRYGICHGVNLLSFAIPIPEIPEISTGYWLVDLAVRSGISHFIAWGIARVMGWHHDE